MSSAPDAQSILNNVQFTNRKRDGPLDLPNATDILSGGIDATQLHPLAGFAGRKNEVDYLLLEDEKLSAVEGGKTVIPSRGWNDEVCYGTGTTYLAGMAMGGLWGLKEGVTKPITLKSSATSPLGAAAIGASLGNAASGSAAVGAAEGTVTRSVPFRLRWNNILNHVTRRGTFTANSAGVLALIYNGFNSSIDAYRGGKHDIYGSMTAGFCTGLLFKSTAGLQPMIISAGLMTAGAAVWTKAKTVFL